MFCGTTTSRWSSPSTPFASAESDDSAMELFSGAPMPSAEKVTVVFPSKYASGRLITLTVMLSTGPGGNEWGEEMW